MKPALILIGAVLIAGGMFYLGRTTSPVPPAIVKKVDSLDRPLSVKDTNRIKPPDIEYRKVFMPAETLRVVDTLYVPAGFSRMGTIGYQPLRISPKNVTLT